VFDGNIYFQKNPFMTPVRLTDDHSPLVRNGVADWLYERTWTSRLLCTNSLVSMSHIGPHSLFCDAFIETERQRERERERDFICRVK